MPQLCKVENQTIAYATYHLTFSSIGLEQIQFILQTNSASHYLVFCFTLISTVFCCLVEQVQNVIGVYEY